MLKHLRYFIVFVIIGILFYVYLYYSENAKIPSITTHLLQYIGVICISILASIIIRLLNSQLNKIIPWHSKLSIRFGISTVLNFIVFPLCAFILISFLHLISGLNFPITEYINTHLETTLRLIVLSITFGFTYAVIDFSYFSYNHYSNVQIESERQIRKQIELQYEALKTQLSPHYLFNSLNTISLLIYKDHKLTEEFVRKLALTYQYILESNEKKLTSIKEEIDFIRAYTYLIKVRYEESFNIEINIPENIEHLFIPPLSIQILLENAVKHNVLSNEEPLHVSIHSNKTFLIIENNILKKPSTQHSFKIGHNNIMNRYEYFTDRKILIAKSDKYMVQLPIISA
jgi:two-component system, LytTR family, sensor kinase